MVDSNRIRPFLSENARGEEFVELESNSRSQESPVFVNPYGTNDRVGYLYYPSEAAFDEDTPAVLKFYSERMAEPDEDCVRIIDYDETLAEHREQKERSYLVVLKQVGRKLSVVGIATTFTEAYSYQSKDGSRLVLPLMVLEYGSILPYLKRKQLLREINLLIQNRNEQR